MAVVGYLALNFVLLGICIFVDISVMSLFYQRFLVPTGFVPEGHTNLYLYLAMFSGLTQPISFEKKEASESIDGALEKVPGMIWAMLKTKVIRWVTLLFVLMGMSHLL